MTASETHSDLSNATKKEWTRGWVIVMSAFFLCFITDGCVYSFGILLVEFTEYFDDGRASVATIVALQLALQYVTGPLTSALGQTYGYRKMTVIGAILSCIGFVVSSFATNVYHLWISYGLLGGLGFGFMYMSAMVCVLQHFHQHRSLATGITCSGSGAGTFILSFFLRLCTEQYGWRGAVLLLAGVVLQGAIFGLLLTEPKQKETEAEKGTSFVSSVKTILKSVFKKELLTDLRCMLFLLSNFIAYIALIVPFIVPDQAVQAGMSKTQAAVLSSSIGITNTISRVIFGWIGDRVCFSRTYLMTGVVLLNGLLTGVSPLLTSFETKLTYTILFGTCAGAFQSLVFVVITDIVRPDLIASALGLLFLHSGTASGVSAWFAGFLFDQTGGYTVTFIVCGAEFVLEACLLILCKLVPSKASEYDVNT